MALDAEQSYFWLFLAAWQGNSAAMAGLDTATASLTDAARRKIEQQVHNWAPFGNNLSGAPEVVDGETLIVAGQRLRLEGISVPAPGTRCQLRGNDQNCGRISTTALMDLTAGVVWLRSKTVAASPIAAPAGTTCRRAWFRLVGPKRI